MSLINPAPGGVQGRTDQGVDWSNIRGSIGAVAGGVITNVYRGLSGFGTTVVEKIKGSQPVYYGLETGGGNPVVHVGQTVAAGQEIAPGLGTGGIEVGYWDAAGGHAAGYQPGVTSGGSTAAGRSFLAAIKRRPVKAGASSTNVPGYVPGKYIPWVQSAAQGTGLPASVVAAQIKDESGFDPSATSPTGAQGIAQIEPATWKTLGLPGSPYSPNAALQGYTKLMGQLLSQYHGNVRDALAAYNAGPNDLAAGYGYADSIIKAAGIPSSATASPSSNATITRPGGQSSNQQPGNEQGIAQAFTDYETLLNSPRQAPPGLAASLGGNPFTAPFRWWLNSFTGNWNTVDAGPTGGQQGG